MPTNSPPVLVDVGGAISEDGSLVVLGGKTSDEATFMFAMPRDQVSSLVALLANLTNEAARKADWRPPSFEGREDKGLWMLVTGATLFDGARPDHTRTVLEMGAVRFRFELPGDIARTLGRALMAASAPESGPRA